MKKCLVYSIVIYLLIMMYINLKKPDILYDENNNLKSIDYFKFKLKYGFQNINEMICMPTIAIASAILSFILAKQIVD